MIDLVLPPRKRGAIILVSGDRRIGKTTMLLAVRKAAIQAGYSVGGVLSVARFEHDSKTGIDLMDAASGTVVPLATVGGGSAIRTPHYSFDAGALALGLDYANQGQRADVFFVDELGPLELVRGEGWAGIIPLVQARRFGVALVVVRPELLAAAREVFHLLPESPLITVTEDNRDRLADAVAAWIRPC
ncbi:MAG: hypothetical protein JW966_06895 [Anaerolineae bacterium]|nr:hypothetical protein [Anaerolineae bacterium]